MADFALLKREIKGKIYTSSDKTTYDNEINKSWDASLRSQRPLAFVVVRGKEDVEKTVKFCVENELEVCVSAGRTSVMSMKDGAVVIDLSEMRRIQVDPKHKTAVIEGGTKVADVDKALHEFGFVIPLSSYSQLGVAGMTLMGGQGFLSRHFGLTSDCVIEYDIVLASGESLKVSAEQNPELFWGMKGFGANFGVVTSMKFQVYEIPKLIVGGSMLFEFSRAKEVLKMIRDYSNQVNDNCLSFYLLIHVGPAGPELVVRMHYSGTIQRGEEIVKDVQDLTHPSNSSCGPVEHPDFQKEGDHLTPRGKYNVGAPGHVISELTNDVIDSVIGCVKDVGSNHVLSGSTIFMAQNFGGKDSEVGYEESSCPFRKDARYWIGVNGSTKEEANLDALKQWADDFQTSNAKYGLPLYHGGNADEITQKLKNLKQQFDPNNVFHNNFAYIDLAN